jgi:phage tail sheath protein FI
MSVFLSHPGIYIEEVPSGVRTITGVATSIAAFVGWTAKGPTDTAVLVRNWLDFQSQFGGLSRSSGSPDYLGYAVNHFFSNGGQSAYIVRLIAGDCATACAAANNAAKLSLEARNPGAWGNSLRVSVTVSSEDANRFTLEVKQDLGNGNTRVLETFFNLTFSSTDPAYVLNVINNDSQYIRLAAAPTGSPATATVPLENGGDGTTLAPGTGGFAVALGTDATSPTPNGLSLLDRVPIFNLLCVPGETDGTTIGLLQKYCVDKRAFLIVDSPSGVQQSDLAANGPTGTGGASITGANGTNAAYYYPWVQAPDPLLGNRPALFPPCGFVAGIYASTDTRRGVWKAPAGTEASLTGATGLQHNLTDPENGPLNERAVNCLRHFSVYGDVVWGARTMRGGNQVGSEWKYIPIRRLALFIESSLYEGTQWVVFEPNDAPLWSQIRLNIGSFLHGLYRQGAFQGSTPQQAYFVKCDAENNPQASINQGVVNILVGFAPLYPAEFVVIQIQQMAGQLKA